MDNRASLPVRQPYSYRDDPAVPQFPDDHPVIVFDGFCVMCSAFARFVLRHDRRARFRMLAAQSKLGRALYGHYGLNPGELETILLIEAGSLSDKSEAVLGIARGLGFPWTMAAALRAVPKPLRDRLYMLVARKRYRWFGARESCFVPGPDHADRFLE